MKSTIRLILLSLLIHSFSFGQTITNYGPFPKISDDVYNFNYLTDSYVLLEKCNLIDTRVADKKRINYHMFELQDNTTMVSKKIILSSGAKSGVILKSFLSDSYIIELVGYMVVFNSHIDVGIVKRDRKTLEQVGEMKLLDENLHFISHDADIFETSNGFAFIRKVEDRYMVSYLDENFNELKKIPLQGKGLRAGFQVTENDELVIFSTDFLKNNSYNYHITIVNPNGGIIEFEPQLNLTGPMGIRAIKIFYSPKSEQIEGIFQYSMAGDIMGYDPSRKEESYKYYVWNLDGEILDSKSHTFTVDEVYGEYKAPLLKKYSEKNLSDDFSSIHSNTQIISSKEGHYMIIRGLTYLPPMLQSFHIVKLDKNGDLQWIKLLPVSLRNSAFNFYETADGNLRALLLDANSTISNGKHEVDMTKKVNADESFFFNILIDKKSGELLEENLVDLHLPEGSKIKKVDLNPRLKKYLIESIQNKLLTFSVVSY